MIRREGAESAIAQIYRNDGKNLSILLYQSGIGLLFIRVRLLNNCRLLMDNSRPAFRKGGLMGCCLHV